MEFAIEDRGSFICINNNERFECVKKESILSIYIETEIANSANTEKQYDRKEIELKAQIIKENISKVKDVGKYKVYTLVLLTNAIVGGAKYGSSEELIYGRSKAVRIGTFHQYEDAIELADKIIDFIG